MSNPDQMADESGLKPFYRAQREARRARHRNATLKDNPYTKLDEPDAYRGWQKGWLAINKSYEQGKI